MKQRNPTDDEIAVAAATFHAVDDLITLTNGESRGRTHRAACASVAT